MWRNLVVTVVAVLSLAMGIGANTRLPLVLVANLLLGLKGADPVTLIWASLLLLGIATAAAHWQRSMLPESDPLMALRYE